MVNATFDALLFLSFGGPEKHDDVIPFLENVLRGKNVPRERMLEVAEHYYHFDGFSPINDQNREMIAALKADFAAHGLLMPIYWGNRNWHPFLADTIRQMHADGVRRVAVFVTSGYGSYSGCKQYREDVGRGVEATGLRDMVFEKLPQFAEDAAFVEVMTERVRDAYGQVGLEAPLVFTAHSIPMSMAGPSPYVRQLREASEKVAAGVGKAGAWSLVYQSRSGPPSQPWLEPDILAHLRQLHSEGVKEVVVCPIGFCSDHMEVLYDLDTEAAALCGELGLKMVRAGTAGSHPLFVEMVRRQILAGKTTPMLEPCSATCCPAPQRPPVRPAAAT